MHAPPTETVPAGRFIDENGDDHRPVCLDILGPLESAGHADQLPVPLGEDQPALALGGIDQPLPPALLRVLDRLSPGLTKCLWIGLEGTQPQLAVLPPALDRQPGDDLDIGLGGIAHRTGRIPVPKDEVTPGGLAGPIASVDRSAASRSTSIGTRQLP